MPPRPSGWQSFMDYLALNEDSLRELEERAAERAAALDADAGGALALAQRESEASIRGGGTGELTGAASYSDFTRARREAERVRAMRGGGREGVARGFLGAAGGPDYDATIRQAQGNLTAARTSEKAARDAAETYRQKQEAERKAQAEAFSQAQRAMGPGYADRQAYGRYSDAVQRSSNQARARGSSVRAISDEEINRWNQ